MNDHDRHLDKVHIEPLLPEDVPVIAAIYEAMRPGKGMLNGPQARAAFNAAIALTPAASAVEKEPGMVAGVSGWWCRPAATLPNRRLIYLGGGGYVLGSARAFCHIASQIASRAKADAFVPDYRNAPEAPFPAAFDDCWSVYRDMASDEHTTIALAGESSGGGLALAIMAHAQSLEASGRTVMKPPCGAALMSPWTDLLLSGESLATRASTDPILTRDSLAELAALYLNGHAADDARASPLYANLGNLPPVRIDVGDDEVLLDDSLRIAARARASGVEVTLSVWEHLPHVFPAHAGKLISATRAFDAIGRFLDGCFR
jgi:epsilon-lactone hydrolase